MMEAHELNRGIYNIKEFVKEMKDYYELWNGEEGLNSDEIASVVVIAMELYERIRNNVK